MEQLLSIAGVIFALYLIFKLNRVLTVSIGVVNTTVELADKSVTDYANDVLINLAQKRTDQFEEIEGMDAIYTSDDISSLIDGKTIHPEPAKPKRRTARTSS